METWRPLSHINDHTGGRIASQEVSQRFWRSLQAGPAKLPLLSCSSRKGSSTSSGEHCAQLPHPTHLSSKSAWECRRCWCLKKNYWVESKRNLRDRGSSMFQSSSWWSWGGTLVRWQTSGGCSILRDRRLAERQLGQKKKRLVYFSHHFTLRFTSLC